MLTKTGVKGELFHTATGITYADLVTDGRRETWPIRSKRFRLCLRQQHYEATGMAPSAGRSTANSTSLKRARFLTDLNAQFTSGSPSTRSAYTSISPTKPGKPSRSAPVAGG